MLRTARLSADEAGLSEAAAILRRGGLVAFPTETVYGLGADATQSEAVAGIYAAKERPSFNPLISHLESFEAAKEQGLFDETARKLAEAFWPGPLTLVVPVAPTCTISDLARAGLDSVGLRVPAHPLAHALLKATGRPVAAPSANRSGRVSPTASDHVLGDLDGRIDAVVEGGAADVGVESTIVACLGGAPRLLRPGGVAREAIEALIGQPLESGFEGGEKNPLAPGMLASHYAPRAQVRLNATRIEPGEAALLFGSSSLPKSEQAKAALNLSESGDLKEAAAHLFSYLRRLDASGAHTIAVASVPETGLGEAINDRLRRAAAER
ncbi:L-threonylcarbamoyladenylate synthase [Microvirga guangxiensis]|uniref:Threonylcarbamoyl-AMP synthase n=1 Tax=Microvirga guangxiensis TaxID=549386 RepID=A0A1G5JNP2_9HYPH|nr:L-threonylcarbamoyladenylate synthase [Microvirga guangxiensis]